MRARIDANVHTAPVRCVFDITMTMPIQMNAAMMHRIPLTKREMAQDELFLIETNQLVFLHGFKLRLNLSAIADYLVMVAED